jgi:hypothetical protein
MVMLVTVANQTQHKAKLDKTIFWLVTKLLCLLYAAGAMIPIHRD